MFDSYAEVPIIMAGSFNYYFTIDGRSVEFPYHILPIQEKGYNYLSVSSVRTNGLTLCPLVWLPYAPESVEKAGTSVLYKPFWFLRVLRIFKDLRE